MQLRKMINHTSLRWSGRDQARHGLAPARARRQHPETLAMLNPERPAPDPAGEKRPPRAGRALAGPLGPGRSWLKWCAVAKATAFARPAGAASPADATPCTRAAFAYAPPHLGVPV